MRSTRILVTLVGMGCALMTACTTPESPTSSPDAGGKSPQLQRVLAQYKPMPARNPKDPHIQGIWGDIWDVVKGIGTVAAADLFGYASGRVAVDAISDDQKAIDAGGVAGAIVTTIGAAERVINGSDTLVTPQKLIYRPTTSPYSSLTKPNTIDSIGWLHNDGTIDIVGDGYTLSYIEEAGLLRTYMVANHGWSFGFMLDTITSTFLQTVSTPYIGCDSLPQMCDTFAVRTGYVTEASYIESMYNDIHYLHTNNYPLSSVFTLIGDYQDDVSTLFISPNRKDMLLKSLIVFEYSFALWEHQ